jgi:hypothetical protein
VATLKTRAALLESRAEAAEKECRELHETVHRLRERLAAVEASRPGTPGPAVKAPGE